MAFDFDASGNLITASAGGFDFDADGNLLSGEPKDEGGGFLSSAKQAIGATIKGAGQAVADYIPGVSQDNPVARYGRDVIEANPTAVSSFEDMADKPLTAVTEATGNAAGSMAGMLGARALGLGITAAAPLTGPAAPVTAAVGQIIAWLGPAAIAALPSYGGIRDKQILNDPAMEQDAKAKAVAALGAGTVGLIESKFGPQQWALSAMTKEGRSQLAKKFAETGIVKGLAYGAGKGALIEGAEELAQNPIEQLTSFDDPTTPENLKETAFVGAMGAIGGGVLGGGTGAAVNIARPKATVSDVLAAPDVDSAIQAANEVLALPAPGAVTGETILATERGTAGTAAQFDALRRQADIREAGGGQSRNADITDVVPKETAAPATDAASLLERQSDPLAPMIEDRRIRTEAIDAAQQEAEQRKAAELDAIPNLAAEQNTVAAALDRAGSLESPTAMQLALEKAKAPPAPAIEPAPAIPAEPRIVERTPDMVALPRKLAEMRAEANNGEVVRIQNQSGKFAYTIIPKAVKSQDGSVPLSNAGGDQTVARGQPAATSNRDGERGTVLRDSPVASTEVDGAGSARTVPAVPEQAEPVATWFGRRGDGYLTEGDARMAIPSRQRVASDLTWKVERLPTGKFRLAGYAAPGVKSNDGTQDQNLSLAQGNTGRDQGRLQGGDPRYAGEQARDGNAGRVGVVSSPAQNESRGRELPIGSEAAPIAGSRDAIAGRGMEPAGPMVGADGVRAVPASVDGPERRPGLQGMGQGDERASAPSAGEPSQGTSPVPESAAAQVTQTPSDATSQTQAPQAAATAPATAAVQGDVAAQPADTSAVRGVPAQVTQTPPPSGVAVSEPAESAESGTAGPSPSDSPEKWAAKTTEYAKSIAPSAERVGQVADYSLLRDTRPNWNRDDDGRILAVDKTGNVVADMFFGRRDDGKLEVAAEVAPAARRQGIASAIYDQIERSRGENIAPAEQQTAHSRAFWEARRAAKRESPAAAPEQTPAAAKPTERERIAAMQQAAKERKSAEASAKKERMAAEVAKARGKTGNGSEAAPAADDSLSGQEPMFRRGPEAAPGLSRSDFSAALAQAFGPKVAERLESNGVVIPLEDQSSLPDHVVPFVRDGDKIFGFYDPKTDTTYAVLENLTPEMVKPLALHEIGVHYGFEAMLGKDKYTQVINRIKVMGRSGDKQVKAALVEAKKNAAKEAHVPEETLAYLVTNNPEMELVREVVARIKAFLFNKFGVGGKYLTADDMTALARAAVLHASRGEARQADFAGETLFARSTIAGRTSRTYSPEQQRAMRNVGFEVDEPTLKERAQALWQDAGKKMAQGLVDQFAPVKDLDKQAYGLLRLSKGASGAFEVFLRGGKLKLTDGVYDYDDTNPGGVVEKLLIPLQGEHHDFMRWVAANRAERLKSEGKENLFSDQDIADLKTLANGTTSFDYTVQTGPQAGQVTRDRTRIYADSQRIFNEFNKNALDMAEQSGLIDGASRHLWEHEFYVPFYRVADDADGGVRGMNIKGSMVRQQAFKQLKGGKGALNADLLDNTLMNWAHLLDAAAKNRAAKATLEAAERMGVAINAPQSTAAQIGTATGNKNGVVWFMDGGQKRFFVVDDPYVLTAITALEYAGMRNPVMNAMGTMKHVLTVGVTASPFFKVRNLIRDSVQVIGTGNISYNPAKNIGEGFKLTDPKSEAYFRLLAGGGTIHFGTMLEGSEARRVQSLVESGVKDSTILNSDHKLKAFYRQFIEPGITAYNELGNRGEAINRASLYDQLRKQGVNHAEASLQARDLMDFSMQGSFTSIRFLTQVVPFMNARMQGLYKLGRAAKEDPARFSAVLGATALFSLALLAAYSDDDDWKKREEWDRNNFWWFKFGGTAFRIPKPFEIGAIATLAERGFELAFDKEMTGKRFRKNVIDLLADNLNFNPVPQLVKPVLDVYSNKDAYSGRPIETMGMERLKSEYRFNDRTSMTARAASTAMNAATGLVGAEALSPVQIDHMLRGYFGWLGSFVVGAGDVIARPVMGQPKHPTPDYWKVATGGMVADTSSGSSRYVSQMYEQAKEIEQAYGTWRALQKQGKTAEAKEFFQDNKEDLIKYKKIGDIKRAEAKFNERIRIIERSNLDSDVKREKIRKLQQQKDRIARRAS